jgi:hypothetical protein
VNRLLKLTVLLLGLCAAVPVYANGKHYSKQCSLNTFAGTYVSYDRGSSLTIDLASVGVLGPAPGTPPSPPAWVALGTVPFVNVAEVTYSDGVGDGYFWMFAGSLSATLDPIPVHITITEMNEDCTGKFQYTLANGATIEKRFILFDEGREYRSVPTTLAAPGIPTLAWIGTGHRISKSSKVGDSCGQHISHGRYLLACENILRSGLYPQMAVADTLLINSDISWSGDYTGVLYEKFGMKSIELPVYGTMTVNSDCSLTDTLNIPDISSTVILKGAFFDEGKQYYSMGILNPTRPLDDQDIKYSFCQGTRIGQ